MKREKFLPKESTIWPHWIESRKDTLDRETGAEGTLGTEPGRGDGDEEHEADGLTDHVSTVRVHAKTRWGSGESTFCK